MNKIIMNIHVHIFVLTCFQLFWVNPYKSMNPGSYGKCMFSFVGTTNYLLVCIYTTLHSHQQWVRVPVAPHPHHHLVLSVFLSSLGHSSKYVVESHFCFNLHFSVDICLFSICISSLVKCLLMTLVAQLVKNLPTMQETWVLSLGWKGPLEKGMATNSSILAWRIPWTV